MKFWVGKGKREETRFCDKVIELIREGSFHHQYILDSLAGEFPEKSRFQLNHQIRRKLRQLFSSIHNFTEPFEANLQNIQIATNQGQVREKLEHLRTSMELLKVKIDCDIIGFAGLMDRQAIIVELIFAGTDMSSDQIDSVLGSSEEERETEGSLYQLLTKLRTCRLELESILKEDLDERYGNDEEEGED